MRITVIVALYIIILFIQPTFSCTVLPCDILLTWAPLPDVSVLTSPPFFCLVASLMSPASDCHCREESAPTLSPYSDRRGRHGERRRAIWAIWHRRAPWDSS